jgi:uncharacterized protein (DUF488 family)
MPPPNITFVTHPSVWTIGHSNHPSERLLQLLMDAQIDHVIDVRSYPYSRFAPQHNRDALAGLLAAHNIGYLHLGEHLGGRPKDRAHYDAEGHALYRLMSEQPEFKVALNRVRSGATDHRIALLCSEAKPTHCHRRLLVGKVLTEHGLRLHHILPDGNVESEDTVTLPGQSAQGSLLEEQDPWRSSQPVSHRARLSVSSDA